MTSKRFGSSKCLVFQVVVTGRQLWYRPPPLIITNQMSCLNARPIPLLPMFSRHGTSFRLNSKLMNVSYFDGFVSHSSFRAA